MKELNIHGKAVAVWILVASIVGIGSLAVAIQNVNDELISLGIVFRPSETNTVNSTDNDESSDSSSEIVPSSQTPINENVQGAPRVTGVADKTIVLKEKQFARFSTTVEGRTPIHFGIKNELQESQVFLIRVQVEPSASVSVRTTSGYGPIYQSSTGNWWFVEVRPSTSGSDFLIEVLNSGQYKITVEIERAFTLNQDIYYTAPTITGVSEQIVIVEKPLARFAVQASGSIHLTWGLDNHSADTQVYLIKLKTSPEMLINLELIGNSSTRIYQRTNEGYFLTVVRPSESGDKFFSAVWGPKSFTIEGEIERLT